MGKTTVIDNLSKGKGYTKRYNESLLRMMPAFNSKLDYTEFIDTPLKGKMDTSLNIANEVLDKVKRLYIKH